MDPLDDSMPTPPVRTNEYTVMTFQTIAVIGAGTMGAGIAQVAAASGHRVKLLDVRAGAAQAAINQIRRGLDGLVNKGRLSADDCAATLTRLSPAASVAELADAQLVVLHVSDGRTAIQVAARMAQSGRRRACRHCS